MYVLFVLHGFKLVVDTYQLFLLFKITSLGQWLSYLYFRAWIISFYILSIYYLFSFLSVFLFSFHFVYVCVCIDYSCFQGFTRNSRLTVFHHRQTWYCLFFFGCTGLEKIFRVVTNKIGRWGNWKHKYGKISFFF